VKHVAFRGVHGAGRDFPAGRDFLRLAALNHVSIEKLPGARRKFGFDDLRHLLDQVLPVLIFFAEPMGILLRLVEGRIESLRRLAASQFAVFVHRGSTSYSIDYLLIGESPRVIPRFLFQPDPEN
jgi:hypothetical protein